MQSAEKFSSGKVRKNANFGKNMDILAFGALFG